MQKVILLLCLCSVFLATAQTTTVNYPESTDLIANPERGFEKYSITDNDYYTVPNHSNISVATLTSWKTGADKITVIHRNFLMASYMSSAISTTYLNNVQLDFDRIRQAGFKCIVRFYYSDAEGVNAQQPTKAQILAHIAQLMPIVQQNKDVVFSVQMGFIGTWGEWYYTNSSEYGTAGNINSTQWSNRKEIVDAVLNGLTSDIFLQVRYPEIKKTMYGTTALTESTAYGTTASARLGFFNDALLNNWGDMGTFPVNSEGQSPVGTADYTFLAGDTRFTPMSGESNGLNAPRTDGANAVFELDSCNWTTLNRDYSTPVINGWISSGHFATIVSKLGYRFVLEQSTVNLSGTALALSLKLKNVGFARAVFPREVYFVMVPTGGGATKKFLLNTDVRQWGKVINVSQQFDLSTLTPGTYDCYLHFPDRVLTTNTAYAIQLANPSLWSSLTGYNALNQQVNIVVTSNDQSEVAEAGIVLHPNPFEAEINYRSGASVLNEIVVLNALGKEVVRTIPTQSSGTIALPENLSPGVYLVVMKKEGKTVVQKMIKK